MMVIGTCVACNGYEHKAEYELLGPKPRSGQQYIKLDGCLQRQGNGERQFVLQNVLVPDPGTQPQGQKTMEQRPVENGASVSLLSDSDLQGYVGHRVEIMGYLQEENRTAATSGSNAEASNRAQGDANARTQTPTATGGDSQRRAVMAVEHVKQTASACH